MKIKNLESIKRRSPEAYSKIKSLNSLNQETVLGQANKNLVEPLPIYNRSESEKVISGENNTWIVLGRDRPTNIFSGYGGKGEMQSGKIDLVAGRMGYQPAALKNGKKILAEPNFVTDSSRIYISQKADADQYLSLASGKVGNSKTQSAIILKSDDVRIVSRKGTKIVTGTDINDSFGNKINKTYGIDLIAGNDDSDLQPMLKGDNTQECLLDMCDRLEDICSLLRIMNRVNKRYFQEISSHDHISPFFGKKTAPSDSLIITGNLTVMKLSTNFELQLRNAERNIAFVKSNYLREGSNKFIKSYYNNTN